MGKRITQQRRGRGSPTFLAPTHRSIGQVKLKTYDASERTGVIYGKVIDIIHDTFHSAPLMVVRYENGQKALLPAPEGIKVGDIVASGSLAPIKEGNVLPLRNIPEGTRIYMIEKVPGDGGKFVRASGTYGILVQKKVDKAIVQLPSKKVIEVDITARAVIGTIAGGGRKSLPFIKAGNKYYAMRARNRFWPVVSATARNARDHPFGGKHKRNKGGNVPVPKKGYPLKYGYVGPRKTGRGR